MGGDAITVEGKGDESKKAVSYRFWFVAHSEGTCGQLRVPVPIHFSNCNMSDWDSNVMMVARELCAVGAVHMERFIASANVYLV